MIARTRPSVNREKGLLTNTDSSFLGARATQNLFLQAESPCLNRDGTVLCRPKILRFTQDDIQRSFSALPKENKRRYSHRLAGCFWIVAEAGATFRAGYDHRSRMFGNGQFLPTSRTCNNCPRACTSLQLRIRINRPFCLRLSFEFLFL